MSGLVEDEAAHAKIYKFCLTGGPCSGKTTAVERLQGYLSERGFRVFVVPEAATMLFLNGASPNDFGKYPTCGYAFQRFVLRTQIHLEDNIALYAKATNQNCVLLCDRGLMDGAAYVTDKEFNSLLSNESLDVIGARDTRYNAVLHLVTAADGAEAHYTLDNNLARHETPDEARMKDGKTQKAWAGHPHHVIFSNDGVSFEAKMQRLVACVAGFVGLEPTPRRTHVYRLDSLPDLSILPDLSVFNVVKIMLADFNETVSSSEDLNDTIPLRRALSGYESIDGSADADGRVLYSFIRKRSSATGEGADAYGLTTVRELSNGEEVETKQVITKRVYEVLARSADQSRVKVKQRRYCFLWGRRAFSIIEYISPQKGAKMLRCQSDEDDPKLPPFLSVGTKVEDNDESMSARQLSRRSLIGLTKKKRKKSSGRFG
jgi:predicted ATPase